MAELVLQTGWGCHWGLSASLDVNPAGPEPVGTGQLFPLEQDITITRESDPTYDQNGSVIGENWFRKLTQQRMRLYPSGPTLAAAAQWNAVVIEPGPEISISDPNDNPLAGQWSVVEVGKTRRYQEKAYCDLLLRRHGDNTQRWSGTRISQQTPSS
jgi:hypothetical protein